MMNTDAIKRFLMFLSSAVKVERGQLYQLIHAAETSYYLRDVQSQHEIGLMLQSFGYPFSQVGKYYESVFLYRTGQFEKARELLECVAESAPARYRSKALFSLSAVEERIGRFEESLRLRLQIPLSDDPVFSLETQQSIAVLRSREGRHHAALHDLERLLPLAHIIGKRKHPAYLTFLNSYALELSEIGKAEEAEQVANVIAASPFLSRYREWQETIVEIGAKRKRSSMIAVPNELNLKYRDARVKAGIDFMNANFHRKIALDEIADVVNSSSANFRHLFKIETGITPVEYLIRLRMKKARELLKTTFLSVKQVMAASGYNSKSHFTRHFKRRFSVTPSEYRKQFATRKQ
jgi:AraC-like DNA-binding protein